MSPSPSPIPTLPAIDSSLALLREGYLFVGNRCDALGSDAFRTRILLQSVVCMRGPAAAEQFYRPGRFRRRGAIPPTALALLQDRGSVQTLDGESHRHRKQMFMDLMDAAGLLRAISIFGSEWQEAAALWSGRRIVLHDEVRRLLARTAILWCGIPLDRADPDRRTEELSAMIEAAGSFGPAHLHARLLRRRSERWARSVIHEIREGLLLVEPDCPAERIALHRNISGELLSLQVAAVELLNLLRPMVAVARFIIFAAHALHAYPTFTRHLVDKPAEGKLRALVQEIRRFYPFFPMIGGRVLEQFSWRGHRFVPGDWVVLDLYGTNHHAAAWPDPELFDPARFDGWPGDAYSFIAQGGGGFMKGHRCAGEWLTIALMEEGIRQLLAMNYTVPAQDLSIPMNRFPSRPRSGFILVPQAR